MAPRQAAPARRVRAVTVVETRRDALVRVIAFGRLSLFSASATRLHDEILSVAARWIEGSNTELRPFAEDADRKAIETLEQVLAESPDPVAPKVQERVVAVGMLLEHRDLALQDPDVEAAALDVFRRRKSVGFGRGRSVWSDLAFLPVRRGTDLPGASSRNCDGISVGISDRSGFTSGCDGFSVGISDRNAVTFSAGRAGGGARSTSSRSVPPFNSSS